MRVGRISMPGALCGASAAVRTFDEVNRALWYLGVFEETIGANITRDGGDISKSNEEMKFAHIKGFFFVPEEEPHRFEQR